MRAQSPVLALRGVTKRFGGLVAVNAMDFDVAEHEVKLAEALHQRGAGGDRREAARVARRARSSLRAALARQESAYLRGYLRRATALAGGA